MSTNIIATKDLGTIDGFDIRAHIEPDEDGGASMHTDPTREELDAYRDGDWRFVGTVITASRGGVVLGSDSLWGSEYGSLPGVPGFVSPLDGEGTAFVNGYGPQMIAEAIAEAKAKLAEICQPAQKLDPRTWLPYPA